MKFSKWISLAITLFMLAISLQLTAQNKPATRHSHQNYTVVDVGTFGGPL